MSIDLYKMIQLGSLEAKCLLVFAILLVVVPVIEMQYSPTEIDTDRLAEWPFGEVLQVLSNTANVIVRRVSDRSIIQLLTSESIKHQHART